MSFAIMKMTKQEYQRFVAELMPPSPVFKDCLLAFLFGGAICCVAQFFTNTFKSFGLSQEDAATATTIVMVFLGSFSTGLDIYPRLAKYGGAGTLVPITGFSNAVASPAIEFKTEGFVLGVGAKMFTIAGPVIVYGLTASVVYGFIYWIFTLF